MAAIQQRKLQEGLKLMKEAEKHMKTSWLKWKPDYDSAADRYTKAGISFKAAKSYPEAEDAFLKAADALYNNHATFHSAKALEQAASVLKEMKRIPEAVDLVERAGSYYRESGSPDTAAMALIRGAKMCGNAEPGKAIELFLRAGELNVGEDKLREGIEPITSAARILLKCKRYEDAVTSLKRVLELHQQVENFQMMYKIVLSLIVVYLHDSDYVAADNCFKNACGIPGFTSSEEAEAAEKVLECFDQGDSDGIKSCTSQPLFTYLDNEIAKLAKNLRAPGDTLEQAKKGQVPINLIDSSRTPNVTALSNEADVEPLDSEEDHQGTTESSKVEEEEEDDEFAGGLC